MFAVTMISSFKRVFPRNTHVLEAEFNLQMQLNSG
jgi:hypothetical protein